MFKKHTRISLAAGILFVVATATPSLAVESDTSNPNCVFLTNNMTVGSTDATTNGEVTVLQEFLVSKEHLRMREGTPYGTFGNQTKSAVSAFQKANGIIATGYVGPLTRANIETLTCAIGANDSSMLPVSVVPADALPLLTFTSPVDGDLLIKGEKDINIDWTLMSGVVERFPVESTYIMFSLVNASGSEVGTIGGRGLKLSRLGKSESIEKSFTHILKGRRNVIPDGQYKIVATLRYAPSSSQPSDPSLRVAAAQYASQSSWFTVVSPAPKSVIKINASTTTISMSQPVSISWTITPSHSSCVFTDGLASTTTSVPLTGSTVVIPVLATSSYGISCELTSEWPLVGMLYTTSVQKKTTVTIVPDKKPKKCKRDSDIGCNTLYYCNGVISHEPCDEGFTIESISPSPAEVGERITIRGSGFASEGNTVYIDGYSSSASYNYVAVSGVRKSGNSINFKLPSSLLPECAGSNSGGPIVGCPAPKTLEPGPHTLVVKNASGVSNPLPFTVRGQVISLTRGVSMVYLNGSSFPSTTSNDVTEVSALDHCMTAVASNQNSSVLCKWNGSVLYSYTPTVTATPSPAPTPTPITPDPATPRSMRCSNPSIAGLSSGSLACYGIWDSAGALGGQSDVCGNYSYAALDCVVTTPACTSGRAIATAVYSPFTTPANTLQTIATNLNTTSSFLQQNLIRLWEYRCQ